MLRHSRTALASRLCTLCSFGATNSSRTVGHTTAAHATSTTTKTLSNDAQNIEPPLKRHRDQLSVLRALASCVTPSADAPDFRLGGDPWLGSVPSMRNFLLAKAKGRLAARLAIRDYFPNDIVAVAKEVPRVDRWLPLQTPDSILKRVSDGELTASEAMDRLILLLAPVHAWKLYTDLAPEEPWTNEMLHRLLDLLCATNSGSGGAHKHAILDGVDLTTLPDPEEIFYAEELAVQFARARERMTLASQNSRTRPGSESIQLRGSVAPDQEAETREQTAENANDTSSSSSSDSESDADEDALAAVAERSSGRSTWLVQGPAEQLFAKARDQLNTVPGYSSMIRGSAKFHNPRRALELLEAWRDSGLSDKPLELSVYVSVLRSLPALTDGHEDVWPHIRRVLEQAIETSRAAPPAMSLFEAALYSLAETVLRQTEAGKPTGNYVAIGLGLLNELRQLGLEPSLGVMANLLRLIHFTQLTPNNPNNLTRYTCADLVDNFVSELDRRFQARTPTRFDQGWSTDDFNFFPIAMRIASMEGNLPLGEKIDRLLVGTQDRRFLLATSWNRRNYVESYCLLQMNPMMVGRDELLGANADPVQLIQRIDKTYRTHWGTIVITNRLGERFIGFMQRFFTMLTRMGNRNADQAQRPTAHVDDAIVHDAQQLAYRCMCQFLTDLLNHTRLLANANSPLPQLSKRLIPLLTQYADCDPVRAAQSSAEVLKRFEQQATARRPSPTASGHLMEQLIRMTFPMLSRAVPEHLRSNDGNPSSGRTELADTVALLRRWLHYASEHRAVAWSWTPEAVYLLWQHNHLNELPADLFTDVLRSLSTQDYNPSNAGVIEARRIDQFLTPVLDVFEHVISDEFASSSSTGVAMLETSSPAQLLRTERLRIVSRLRDVLRNSIDQSNQLTELDSLSLQTVNGQPDRPRAHGV